MHAHLNVKFVLKDLQMHCGFMDVILLHSGHHQTMSSLAILDRNSSNVSAVYITPHNHTQNNNF